MASWKNMSLFGKKTRQMLCWNEGRIQFARTSLLEFEEIKAIEIKNKIIYI